MDWQEEPATQQQLLLLKEYGFVPTCELTVTQAARLIRQYSKHPPTPAAPPAAQAPGDARAEPAAPPRSGRPSESARAHACQLRAGVEEAERAVKEHPDRPGVRADLKSAVAARQQFWWNTCREGRDLASVGPQAMEFNQYFGARFFPPTWNEVEEVLSALDRAMPDWDKNHPELYYETLKLNFPSLLRQR